MKIQEIEHFFLPYLVLVCGVFDGRLCELWSSLFESELGSGGGWGWQGERDRGLLELRKSVGREVSSVVIRVFGKSWRAAGVVSGEGVGASFSATLPFLSQPNKEQGSFLHTDTRDLWLCHACLSPHQHRVLASSSSTHQGPDLLPHNTN